jgi:glycosyltransferase involved in cell wall biosynthesis
MNILVVSDLYPANSGHSPGKISRALHDIVRRWAESEEVLVLRPFIIPDWRRRNRWLRRGGAEFEGVRLWNVPVLKAPWLRVFFQAGLERSLRDSGFRPQVIVAHLGFNLLFASRLARRLRLPLIAAVHLGDLCFGPAMLGERAMGQIFQQAAGIACRSPIILRRFSEKYPALKEKCFVAYSGIDAAWFQGHTGPSVRFAGWPQRKPVVFCTLASLLACKCIDDNLRALARLSAAVEWRYRIIGEGPEEKALRRLAVSLGIADRVEFAGFLPAQQARRELLSAHVFLMVSRDTFGLAYLEAMACGLLVVGGRGFGIDGILVDGENGFLCAPGDVAEMSALLRRITTELSAHDLETILANSRETASRYTVENAAANYLENIGRSLRPSQAE